MRLKALTFYRDATGQHRWRLRGGNGKNLCTPGEAFSTLAAAEKNAGLALGGTVERGVRATFVGREDVRVEYEK